MNVEVTTVSRKGPRSEDVAANSLVLATQVQRSISVRLRWTFQ